MPGTCREPGIGEDMVVVKEDGGARLVTPSHIGWLSGCIRNNSCLGELPDCIIVAGQTMVHVASMSTGASVTDGKCLGHVSRETPRDGGASRGAAAALWSGGGESPRMMHRGPGGCAGSHEKKRFFCCMSGLEMCRVRPVMDAGCRGRREVQCSLWAIFLRNGFW